MFDPRSDIGLRDTPDDRELTHRSVRDATMSDP